MRRSREKKVRGQITRDKRGDHSRHTDEDNRRGEQRNIPERRGVRTAQTGLGRGFGVLCPGCLHWEGKRRVVFISERNWYDGGGVENGALLIPPVARLELLCSTFVSPSWSQTQKHSDAHRGHKSVFGGVGPRNSVFFKKK